MDLVSLEVCMQGREWWGGAGSLESIVSTGNLLHLGASRKLGGRFKVTFWISARGHVYKSLIA